MTDLLELVINVADERNDDSEDNFLRTIIRPMSNAQTPSYSLPKNFWLNVSQ